VHISMLDCLLVGSKVYAQKAQSVWMDPFPLDTISLSFLHGFKQSKWYGYANMSSTQSLWTLDTKRKANGFKLFESLNVQWMDCLLYLYSSFAQSINELYCDLYNDI